MSETKFLVDVALGSGKSNFSDVKNDFINHLDYRPNNKFENDKVFIDNETFLLVFDGIALNKNELIQKSNSTSWPSFILDCIAQNKDDFFDAIQGSYFGLVVDKKTKGLSVFTDHIGSKHIYYYKTTENLVVASSHYKLTTYLKNSEQKLSLNTDAAYFILSYGFPIEDMTIVKGVKRLLPGHYLKLIQTKVKIIEFCRFSNEPIQDSDENIVENVDRLFRNALKKSFEKDIEYGYGHLVALSGGLDSRMTSWVAHEMGYVDQLNMTFSQSDYLDETIAKKIAKDLKHEWMFSFLDNGLFLKDVDRITELSGGNVLYYGLAHGNRMLSHLNTSNFGILHSGQLGDVIIGTYNDTSDQNQAFKLGDGAYSKRFIEHIEGYALKLDYPNQEIFKLFNRGFIGINYGLVVSQNYMETFSPFYDIDLLRYCLTIPIEKRYDHYIYKEWIKKKYPRSADYVWEKTGQRPDTIFRFKIKGKEYSLKQIWNFFLKKTVYSLFKRKNYGINSTNHMNPLTYWFNTNEDIKSFYESYYKEAIPFLDEYPDLRKNVEHLNTEGTVVEKIQILTLLSAAKHINQ